MRGDHASSRKDLTTRWNSSPCTAGKNGGFFAIGEVANAEDDNSFGKRDARENGSGDSTGIHITGMRNEARTRLRNKPPLFRFRFPMAR